MATTPSRAEAEVPSEAAFFGVSQSSAVASESTGIYPHGPQIGFGAYSVKGQNVAVPELSNMARIARQGFTIAGPYYEADWRDFQYAREAAREGIKFTYQIRPHSRLIGVSVADRPAVIESLTDAQIQASVRQQVLTNLADPEVGPAIARWSLKPEELRYWYEQEMRYLRLTEQAIRQAEHAIGAARRPFWMYEPNHRHAAALHATGQHQDLIGKGTYLTTRSADHDQRVGFALWSFDQITTAAAGLNKTPQGVFQLFEDFEDPAINGNPQAIQRTIRHDVYLGLVSGLKGVQVFSMWEHRPNLTTHNEQFEAYGSVATDLTGDLNLQRPLLFGERRQGIDFNVLAGDRWIDYTHTDDARHRYESLSTLDVSIDGSRYVFMVNSGKQPMQIELDGLPLLSVADDLLSPEGQIIRIANRRLRVDLEPLGVKVLRFRPLTGDLSGNGVIDAADYTVYRDVLAQPDSVLARIVRSEWEEAYGLSGAATAVPEPLSVSLLAPLLIAGVAGSARLQLE